MGVRSKKEPLVEERMVHALKRGFSAFSSDLLAACACEERRMRAALVRGTRRMMVREDGCGRGSWLLSRGHVDSCCR